MHHRYPITIIATCASLTSTLVVTEQHDITSGTRRTAFGQAPGMWWGNDRAVGSLTSRMVAVPRVGLVALASPPPTRSAAITIGGAFPAAGEAAMATTVIPGSFLTSTAATTTGDVTPGPLPSRR